MKDTEGNVHAVDESLAFEPWGTVTEEAGQLVPTEPVEKIAEELEKIRKSLVKQ